MKISPSTYLSALIPLLATLSFSSNVSAIVVAEADLSWDFNVPVDIRYNVSPPEVGGITEFTSTGSVGSRAQLDSSGNARIDIDDSFVEASFDISDGSSSIRVQSADPNPGSFSRWSWTNMNFQFSAFTDIFTFSYEYNFQGTKEEADDWLNFFVQTEVFGATSTDTELFYTDYDPSHPTYQTNWPGDNRGPDLFQSASGRIDFSFGEAGEFRTWVVGAGLIVNARDSFGAPVAVVEPSTLSITMLGALMLLGRRPFKLFISRIN